MTTELPNFKNKEYKTAQRVRLQYGQKFIYLVAEWNSPPLGYGSRFRTLARSTSEAELLVWWDMQNESIPLSRKPIKLVLDS